MKSRRSQKQFVSRNIPALATIGSETLEQRQLLAATGTDNQTGRTLGVYEDVAGEGFTLTIEEVHRVHGETWVVSNLVTPAHATNPTSPLPENATYLRDSIVVPAHDGRIRRFRIGGYGNWGDPNIDRPFPESVQNLTDFHNLLEGHSTEQLYARVDPALSEWRDNVLETLTEQADDRYGDQFGQETEQSWPIYYLEDIDLRFVQPITARSLNFFSVDVAADANADFSETNVQVNGVDEGDIIETDGEYIYTITNGQELIIVRAATETSAAQVVSRTDLAIRPVAMFLHDGKLTVISQDYAYSHLAVVDVAVGLNIWNPGRNKTTVSVIDVADPATPAMVKETIVDGSFQTARAIGNQVYIVISNNTGIPYLPTLNVVEDATSSTGHRYESREAFVRRLNAIVNGHDGHEGITPPSVYQRSNLADNPGSSELQRLGWLNGAEDWIDADSGQLTSVLRFDTTSSTPGPVDNIGIYHRPHSHATIYASQNAMYLIATEYEQVERGGFFLTPFGNEASSRIDKIDISSDKMTHGGTGRLPGTVDNQFSIDEYNGYLRVATTTGSRFGSSARNHLFVLEDVGTELLEVGSVRDLAPGEFIYSARFDGDRAWIVTFRKVDPVFSFDLSDPTDPKVTGELKIPGYSDYLQLIGENHLLAIGRGATEDGLFQEVQVSLFDVSDMTDPTLLHRFSFDGGRSGSSDALYNHLAFNYLPETGILAVPFRSGYSAGQGLTLLKIDAGNGISLAGEIDPTENGNIQRSVQINDLLHAVSTTHIQTIDLDDPSMVIDNVELQEEAVPVQVRETLLDRFRAQLWNRLDVRQYIDETGAEDLRVELREVLGNVVPEDTEDQDFEFRILNVDDGSQVLQEVSTAPFLSLNSEAISAVAPGTYNFQVRSRSNLLQNPEWSEWSPASAVTLGSELSEMISSGELRRNGAMLKWSSIYDEIRIVIDNGLARYITNPVDHYELWLSDANTATTIEWYRDIEGTEFDLSNLPAGDFWVWFRPAYEDGTLGDWSRRQSFAILADQLGLVNPTQRTADRRPTFAWEELADAASFEVEVTSPDGSETVYSATDLAEARLEFAEDLDPGTYVFRVRALLASGGTTEWTGSHSFTIVDRPVVSIANNIISWEDNDAERHELWVSRDGSTEPLFHDTNLTATQIDDAITTLGLDNFGRFSVWVRSFMADGSRTAWSPRAVLQRFAEAVAVNPISSAASGESVNISWATAEGVESYEVYIQKAGESGAVYRQAGLTGLAHTISNTLGEGKFLTWVRGALVGGGFTKWGPSHAFEVGERLQVSVADNVVSWLSSGSNSDAKYEVWVNRVDNNLRLLDARVTHLVDVTGSTLDLNLLPDGKYSVWVREIGQSDWSERVNFDVSPTGDLVDAFQDGIDDLLGLLDGI